MKRKPLAILPRWILLSSVLVSSVTFVPCYSTTLASHTLRHRQRGPSGLPRPSRDDGGEPLESSSRPNDTFTSYSSSSSVTSSPSPVPPSSLPPREVTVSQHEEARLTCDLPADYSRGGDDGGSAPPRFEPVWRHGEEVVDAVKVSGSMLGRVGSLGHRFTRDSITGQLNIANVRLDDDGLWRCEDREPVTGALLATSAPIRLVVLEPPRAPYLSVDGRRLDPGNVFVPVKEGAELSLWCTVDGGHPAPTLSWLLDSAALDATRLDAPAQRHWRAEARLGPVLRDHHNATVTCLVSHVTLSAPLNVSLLLDVQYSPSFMISRIPGFGFPITEGIPVSLKCDVDSNPPSSPVWAKDDGPPPVAQSGDGFLNFSSIRRDHSGWYKCTCRHPLGEFSSIGYFLNIRYEEEGGVTQGPGDNWATDHQVEVALGGAVQLQCPPGSVSCWSRVGPGGLLEPVGPGPELGLDRVLYQEAGEYRCVVGGGRPELDQWRVGGSVDLVVTGVPEVFPLNKTLTSLTGQQLALTVEFCANPAASHVVWLTPSKAMLPGDFSGLLWAQPLTAGSSPHCQQAALMMRVVTLDDEGEYVFVVRSPRGLAEGTITLNVTHASSFSVPAARAYHMSAALSLLVVALTLPQFYIKQTICV